VRGVEPRPHRADALPRLQALQARLLAGGRPVQIRTFHGWFAALLRNAPLAVLRGAGPALRHTSCSRTTPKHVDKVWRRFHEAVAADRSALADYEASVATHGRSQTAEGAAAGAVQARRVLAGRCGRRGACAFSRSTPRSKFAWTSGPRPCAATPPRRTLAGPGARWARVEQDAAEGRRCHRRRVRTVAADPGGRVALLRKASSSPTRTG
jgi:ATP-dependent helicase/nuclease subunit A